MFWLKIEEIIGEDIPECIKKILSSCGYDTVLSLQNISLETVKRIEKHVNEHLCNIAQELNCCHKDFYMMQREFKFLPGHSDFLIGLSRVLSKCNQEQNKRDSENDMKQNNDNEPKYEPFHFVRTIKEHPRLSVVLKELIMTALRNGGKANQNSQYTDVIRYFATYIYIVGGRSCYEVLYKNLPLPSVSTVCKLLTQLIK